MNRENLNFSGKILQAIDLTPWKARQINRFLYQAIEKKFFLQDLKKNEKYYCLGKKKYKNTDRFIPKVKILFQ